MNRVLFISIFISILFPACSDETANRKHINPAEIYFDYKIKGEEKDSDVAVYLQYKRSGPNGMTIFLTDPAKVELDGELIPVDSAKLAGAFYDIEKPANEFSGTHTILFTDLDNQEYKEEFVYQPFKLKTKIPAVINRGDLAFDFTGLEVEDYIRVIFTDTAFRSRDIHEIDTVKNNRLLITADKLKNLVDGPITLQLYKETEKSIKNGTPAGGRIALSYGMQREFVLKTPKSP